MAGDVLLCGLLTSLELLEVVGGIELLLLEAGGCELCDEVLCNSLGPELLISSGGGGVPGVEPDLVHESEMC